MAKNIYGEWMVTMNGYDHELIKGVEEDVRTIACDLDYEGGLSDSFDYYLVRPLGWSALDVPYPYDKYEDLEQAYKPVKRYFTK